MEKRGLTKRQTEIMNFLRSWFQRHEYSPSYREIMEACNIKSPSNVTAHINNLADRGHLTKTNSARSIRLSE